MYDKKIPASGKSIINFSGEQLMIKSLKIGSWVVHVETRGIAAFFPHTFTREMILDYLAVNIEDIRSIREHSFYEDEQILKDDKETSVGHSCGGVEMLHYSDGSLVKPSLHKNVYDFTRRLLWD